MTTVYIVSAVVGFALLIVGLVLDDFLDTVDIGPDFLSIPIIAAALGSFGVSGWVTGSMGAAAGVAAIMSLLVAILFGFAAAWFSSKVQDGSTDATPQASDLVGTMGKVITPIVGGRGEVLVRLGGQQRKITALCATDIALGEPTVTIEVITPTQIRVEPNNSDFWTPSRPELGE